MQRVVSTPNKLPPSSCRHSSLALQELCHTEPTVTNRWTGLLQELLQNLRIQFRVWWAHGHPVVGPAEVGIADWCADLSHGITQMLL